MVSNGLVDEIEFFSGNFHRLQKLFSETKLCLDQVDYNHSLDKDPLLDPDEEAAIKKNLDLLPRFMILGSCQFSKAIVVNELLSQPVLPTQGYEDSPNSSNPSSQDGGGSSRPWRSIRIKYGEAVLGGSFGVLDIGCPMISRLSLSDVVEPVGQFRFGDDRHSDEGSGLANDGCGSLDSSGYDSCERDTGLADNHLRSSVMEIPLAHELLSGGADIFIPYNCADRRSFRACLRQTTAGVLPLVLFVVGQKLGAKDEYELAELRSCLPSSPIFFVKSPDSSHLSASRQLPESDWYSVLQTRALNSSLSGSSSVANYHHETVGESNGASGRKHEFTNSGRCSPCDGGESIGNVLIAKENTSQPQSLSSFQSLVSLGYFPPSNQLRRGSTIIAESYSRGYSWTTGDFPKSGFAKGMDAGTDSEANYHNRKTHRALLLPASQSLPPVPPLRLKSYFVSNFSEFRHRISDFSRTLLSAHCVGLAGVTHNLHTHLLNVFILTAFDMARDQMITPKRISFARSKEAFLYGELQVIILEQQSRIQNIIHMAIDEARDRVIQSVANETPECVTDLEEDDASSSASTSSLFRPDVSPLTSVEAVERFVLRQLTRCIAERLSGSFRCLRVTFIDTISRCLDTLENLGPRAAVENCGRCYSEMRVASEAFKEILNATYNIEITVRSGRSFLQMLWDKMKHVVTSGPPRPRASSTILQLSEETQAWRQKVASDVIDNLSEARLARCICAQLHDRIRVSHANFQFAINKLDAYHRKRLVKAEHQHLTLRKVHAPKMARLTMESLALRDSLLHGMPLLGPEIGRGQYGVVYACERWGSHGPCAVKSVVPPDDKHWNDLALEFFYTKNLPEHRRIVRLYGAVIDHNYGGGGGGLGMGGIGAVLLIMERLKRDLFTGIRHGLPWPARLRIGIDVVEGIRFLHAQGLVHRDIKLKNVLLDDHNRGKITDLGFCKPEAMMSGSVVGTPIHMAPELFTGHYDASVDVYAFGILFWYICAGHVRLPQAFETCASKDQLFNSVRKGTRPERLNVFDDECWDIMTSCWSADPNARPHVGDIQPRLEDLLTEFKSQRRENSPPKA